MQDLKIMKSENERLKLRLKEGENQSIDYEKKLHDDELKSYKLL